MGKRKATPAMPAPRPFDLVSALQNEHEQIQRDIARHCDEIERLAREMATTLLRMADDAHARTYLLPPRMDALAMIRERYAAVDALRGRERAIQWFIDKAGGR